MYRRIKRMSPLELSELLSNIFQEGFNTAVKNTTSITVEDLHNVIGNVKGIGDKRMVEVDNAIKKLFNERGINNEQQCDNARND